MTSTSRGGLRGRYEQLVRQGDLSIRGGSKAAVASPRSRGCQGDLERARRLQKLWDTGAYDSLKALALDRELQSHALAHLVRAAGDDVG